MSRESSTYLFLYGFFMWTYVCQIHSVACIAAVCSFFFITIYYSTWWILCIKLVLWMQYRKYSWTSFGKYPRTMQSAFPSSSYVHFLTLVSTIPGISLSLSRPWLPAELSVDPSRLQRPLQLRPRCSMASWYGHILPLQPYFLYSCKIYYRPTVSSQNT